MNQPKDRVFSSKFCNDWKDKKIKKHQKMCCNKPDYQPYLLQDRSIDEMPTLYKKCKNCQNIIRLKRK